MNELIHKKDLNREHTTSSHTVDARYGGRITDEIVERIGTDGEKTFGEVIATFRASDQDFQTPDELIDDYGTMSVVRYSDKFVGIASRAQVGENSILHPGRMLNVDETIYFGRLGDTSDAAEPVMLNRTQVLGREALTGISSSFEPTVSRIQGSLRLNGDMSIDISDGHEYADPQTRVVIDKKSLNGTMVHASSESIGSQSDIIASRLKQEVHERNKERLAKIFGVPERMPKDRFGNNQDRISLISDESRQESAQAIAAVGDLELLAIINAHSNGLSGVELVDVIRTDQKVREELAMYLMKKVDTDLERMPDRIRDRGQKSGNHPGYFGNMLSKEYAALLAISMLDGTFISKRSNGDPVEFVSSGNETRINGGQHRLAALRILNMDHDASPEFITQVRTYS